MKDELTLGVKLDRKLAERFKEYCKRRDTNANKYLAAFIIDCLDIHGDDAFPPKPLPQMVKLHYEQLTDFNKKYFVNDSTFHDMEFNCINILESEIITFSNWAFYHCNSDCNDLSEAEAEKLREEISELSKRLESIQNYIISKKPKQ